MQKCRSTCANTRMRVNQYQLCFVNEVIGIIPMGQQVSTLLVINTNVVIGKKARKKVVYFSGHIKYIANSRKKTKKNALTF